MVKNLSESAERVLTAVESESRARFRALVDSGQICGAYDDLAWIYRGSSVLFCEAGGKRSGSARQPALDALSGRIARAMVVDQISSGRRPSTALVRGRTITFRLLASIVNEDLISWCGLTRATFVRLLARIKADPGMSEATIYNRAGSLQAIVEYLNRLQARIDGKEVRFLRKVIIWKHRVENPIRKIEDPESAEFSRHSRSKHRPDIAIALARARNAIVATPEIEPTPGYDRIRLEALAPALAVGARIGECISLPVRCLDRSVGAGYTLLRQPVEKSNDATSVPVPEVWEKPLEESVGYLVEACAEARARARLIEEEGFAFLRDKLDTLRNSQGLSPSRLAQIKLSGCEDVYFIDEFCACFDVSQKTFNADGRYKECLIALPKPTASVVVQWLDERFSSWDWDLFTHRVKGDIPNGLSVDGLVRGSGADRASVKRMSWFIADLRVLLRDMSVTGAFSAAPSEILVERFRLQWMKIRRAALSNRGGAHAAGVVLSRLEIDLRERYAKLLSQHFSENFSAHGNHSGGGFIATSPPAGVPRRLSEHLIVVWDTQTSLGNRRGFLPSPLRRPDIYRYLSDSSIQKSIFRRANIRDDEGEVVAFSPHMIRHWVTDAMLRAGANELVVDAWMNRAPRQGRQYDHRTAKERAEQRRWMYLEKGSEPNDFLGRRVRELRSSSVSEEEIQSIIDNKLSILHVTPYGTCSRELYTSPCDKTLVCIRGFGTNHACRSFQVDVTDQDARRNIEQLRASHQRMLGVLMPNYHALGERLEAELDHSEPLDQHIEFLLDVVRSCDRVLKHYCDAQALDRRNIDMKVI
ncbi:TPA: hypothetical protein UM690_001575 [Stenotrophomonas maltophilia]|nr:hypothetical protein [Stenotrophomonas maltophilia]HEL4288879.1 hypothetical protein [Stenotrophomonas maltophilia]